MSPFIMSSMGNEDGEIRTFEYAFALALTGNATTATATATTTTTTTYYECPCKGRIRKGFDSHDSSASV
jgi:hypothetical protein